MNKPESQPTPVSHEGLALARVKRLRTLAIVLVLATLGITVKLFSIQVVGNAGYQEMARRQYERRAVLEAERGIVYDRNMNKIAVNLINYSFAADPSFMPEDQKDRVADNFARVFGKPRGEYRKLLSKPGAFVWLERKVPQNVATKINDSIRGLIRLESLRRNYPYGKPGASIVGMTNIDNRGAAGIELDQEDRLGGQDGWAILQADALGRLQPNPDYPHQEPVNGKDIQLTIDMNYQTIAYQVLEKTVKDYNADNAFAVIMSPQTGEILAMVNYPGFDPNSSEKFDPELARNRVITDLYEPGSTFKAFSAVAALEEKVRDPNDKIYCENGQMKIYDRIIHDSRKHGMMTFTEVVQKSSNIGIIKTTEKIGPEKLYQYVRGFGFGNETGIDFEGETRGVLSHPNTWSGLSLPMISIGQEIGVTGLQMACAYSAIGNGGTLMKPYVIRSVIDPVTHQTIDTDPQSVRSVASRETMLRVTKMLKEVVEGGTGHRAAIKGIEIAGKTGTAQKINMATGKYFEDEFVASFAGFFPVQDPQLTFLIAVNNPRKSIWGEASAANAARSIVEKIINSSDDFARTINRVMADMDRDSILENQTLEAPDVKYMNVAAAQSILENTNIDFRTTGKGDMITGQSWTFDPKTRKNVLILTTGSAISRSEADTLDVRARRIPDLRGLSMRMAMNKLYEAGMEVRIKGNGYVIDQFPRAGAPLKNGESVMIQCKSNL